MVKWQMRATRKFVESFNVIFGCSFYFLEIDRLLLIMQELTPNQLQEGESTQTNSAPLSFSS